MFKTFKHSRGKKNILKVYSQFYAILCTRKRFREPGKRGKCREKKIIEIIMYTDRFPSSRYRVVILTNSPDLNAIKPVVFEKRILLLFFLFTKIQRKTHVPDGAAGWKSYARGPRAHYGHLLFASFAGRRADYTRSPPRPSSH